MLYKAKQGRVLNFEKNSPMKVVITGASQGLGKCMAEHFAADGHDLILCSRNMDKLQSWQAKLMEQYGVQITSFNVDLSMEAEVKRFAELVLQATAHVDILINNAGTYEPGSTYNEPEGQLEKVMDLNLFSAYHLTRALLPGMMRRKEGHIFNMCSIAALKAYDNGGSYSISKWALTGFTKNLREEMKPHNIKVSMIHPGATYTPSWEMSGIEPTRFMKPEDVAQMVLASCKLSAQACVEEIIMRPQLGDI
jgi:short-subunit dehydrogenase